MFRNSTRRRLGAIWAVTAIALVAAAGMRPAAAAAAAAMEEVVVQGSGELGRDSQRARFEAQIAAYAKDVQTALKDAIRQDLARSEAPRIRVAQSGGAHRG